MLRSFLRTSSSSGGETPSSASMPSSPSFSDFSMGTRHEDCSQQVAEPEPNPFASFTNLHRGSLDIPPRGPSPSFGTPSSPSSSLFGRLSMDASASSRPRGRPSLATTSIAFPGAAPSFHSHRQQQSAAMNIPQLRHQASAPVPAADFAKTAPDGGEPAAEVRRGGQEGKVDGLDYYSWCELLRSSSL